MTWRTTEGILVALSDVRDRTTGDIARIMGIGGPQDTAILRRYLLRLTKVGLVERSQFMASKSTQWRRTAAGTAVAVWRETAAEVWK